MDEMTGVRAIIENTQVHIKTHWFKRFGVFKWSSNQKVSLECTAAQEKTHKLGVEPNLNTVFSKAQIVVIFKSNI